MIDLASLLRFPCDQSKRPLIAAWQRSAARDDSSNWPLVGVPTGKANGFDVLDIDLEGRSWWDAHRAELPATQTHTTRSGGAHLLFKHADQKLFRWFGGQMDEEVVDLSARIIREDEELALPEGITAREFMQMVMRGEIEPTPRQMTAAKVLIEYQEPKLTAVAIGHMDGTSFAQALERAIMRSKSPPPPAALLAPQHPASELKGNFPMRRRNLR
jgi:hypothetical protein